MREARGGDNAFNQRVGIGMENFFDEVDYLRNRLGVFYWTLKRGGDRESAAEQLREALVFTTQTQGPSDASSPSLFLQWKGQQLRFLIETARQALERLGFLSSEENQSSERQMSEESDGGGVHASEETQLSRSKSSRNPGRQVTEEKNKIIFQLVSP